MPKSRRRKPKTRKQATQAELDRALREQRKAFRAQFGRDWGPNDPIFFDRDASEPRQTSAVRMEAEVIAAMTKAGAPPEVIYAYRKTGLLYVKGLSDEWPPDRVEEWHQAIDEYHALEQAKARGTTRNIETVR